jgi:hypothetical protein
MTVSRRSLLAFAAVVPFDRWAPRLRGTKRKPSKPSAGVYSNTYSNSY